MSNIRSNEGIYSATNMVPFDALNDGSLLGFCSPIDDIFTRLLTLTSYISSRFIHFVEELVYGDINRCACGHYSRFLRCSNCRFVADGYSSSSRPSNDEEVDENIERILPVYTIFDYVENYSSGRGIPFVINRLMLAFFSLKLSWRIAMATWKLSLSCIQSTQAKVCSVISRVRITLRGSTDDIGWLQNNPNLPPVTDGSARFLELLQRVRNGKHNLPNSYVYLLIPGLFSNHGPLYFVSTKRRFSKMGLACHIAKIHSESSVEHNAWELKHYIEELYWGAGKRVMLLGHSKGGVVAAAALSAYWNDLKEKVAGLAFVQSPYGGSPLASDILREGQIADKETRRIMELLLCKLIKGDIRALEDLTYEKRKEFIMKNKLPDEIPLVSFHSEASVGPEVLATLSHIAHAELPWAPFPSFGHYNDDITIQTARRVPVIMPVSAAMALCALHLKLRYGEKSDGMVTWRDAEVPGSVVVAPDRKLDHGWMVYSSWRKDQSEGDASEMCEALLTMLVEIGKQKAL